MRISYMEQGSGYPVVFLHGFCQSHTIWKDFVPYIGLKYRAIAVDLPGFGFSSHLMSDTTSIDAMADKVKELLDFLKIDKVILVGHSMGGYVALSIAERYPGLIEGLVMFQSTALADSEEKVATRAKVVQFVKTVGVEKFLDTFLKPLFYSGRLDELQLIINKLTKESKQTPLESIINVSEAMAQRPDRREVLKNADFPILFLIGQNDTVIPFKTYEEQIMMPKNVSVHILGETGHMGMLERFELTVTYTNEFLNMLKG